MVFHTVHWYYTRTHSRWQVAADCAVSLVYTGVVVVTDPEQLKNKLNLVKIPRIQKKKILSLRHSVSLSSCLKWHMVEQRQVTVELNQ